MTTPPVPTHPEAMVDGFLKLGEHPELTLKFICYLRDTLSRGTVPHWRGELLPPLSLSMLCHLPPPAGTGDNESEWRERFRSGLFYYRHGPGFIQIKDLREDAAVLILDDPVLISVFTRALEPMSLGRLSHDEREAVDALIAERILLRLGADVVTLPHRMKRWPIPAYAV